MTRLSQPRLASALEALYATHNRRELVNPDPLHCVYRYSEPVDQEIAGLIAAVLAYGRVAQIMRNVNAVFDSLDPNPRAYLEKSTPAQMRSAFRFFRHRWTTAAELTSFLIGIKSALAHYGSLEAAFVRHQSTNNETTTPALTAFCKELRGNAPKNSLLPDPAKNAACKRLHLYLRWMVRRDDVDPGCWTTVDPARLVIPLDTHMHRIAKRLSLTKRNQPNLATALEITRAFRQLCPHDPVKYDFVLTRFGIRPELTLAGLDDTLRASTLNRSAIPS